MAKHICYTFMFSVLGPPTCVQWFVYDMTHDAIPATPWTITMCMGSDPIMIIGLWLRSHACKKVKFQDIGFTIYDDIQKTYMFGEDPNVLIPTKW